MLLSEEMQVIIVGGQTHNLALRSTASARRAPRVWDEVYEVVPGANLIFLIE